MILVTMAMVDRLGEAVASRLSVRSSGPNGAGALKFSMPAGVTLEDTVKKQAATIHAQALKLHQLQGLLDFALKQKSEEDNDDDKRTRQLEEIIALKDAANKEFKHNVRHLEDALAETKMNLEFMHTKWRDEAAAHEQVLADLKMESARVANLESENRRLKEREAESSSRVAAARSEALDRVQELQALQLSHASVTKRSEKSAQIHAIMKEKLSQRHVQLADKGIKMLCLTHWQRSLEEARLKSQLVRALEKNWLSRRLLLWRHQREALSAQELAGAVLHDREVLEDSIATLRAARDDAIAQATTKDVALEECRQGLSNALLHTSDVMGQNESLAAQLRAYKARDSRELALEEALHKAQFELRVVEEELRLSHDLMHSVRMAETSAETESAKVHAIQVPLAY